MTELRWPATGPRSRSQYLWWHDHRLGLVLAATAAIALSAALVARVAEQRFGPLPQTVAVLASSAAVGIGAGGLAQLEPSWSAAGGAVALFVVTWIWRQVGYVRRRLPRDLLRLASAAGILGLVGLYGRSRAWTYYASMGIRPLAVDISVSDGVALAARPAFTALVMVAVLLAFAWFVSGHVATFSGAPITLVALGTAAAILVNQLEVDRNHGRHVAAGMARPSTEQVTFDPGPTAVCVAPLSPDLAHTLPGPFPRLLWELGTAGPYTLLLDPDLARATYAALRPGDVDAPVWYVPTGQFVPWHAVNGTCDA